MTARARCAAWLGVLLLAACDPNVLIGNAASSRADAGRDAGTSASADAGRDAGRDAGSDAASPPPEISWSSGVHAGNDLQPYLDFASWRARPVALASVYPDRSSWNGLVAPGWPVDTFATFSGKLLLSEPLYPEGMGNNQDRAAGMYDAQWQKLGTFLVAHARADAIVRLGWGGNDMTHAWRADADPSAWLSCFRRVVTALRSSDAMLQIDWSFNPHGSPEIAPGDPYALYPGDAYVDFIGIEAFDQYPVTNTDAQWSDKCNAAGGLCDMIKFARKHQKQVGIAEWGVVTCGGDPGGDNPFFVRKMVETFAANADVLAYEAYFEDDLTVCSGLGSGSKSPQAAAEYQKLYRLP